MIEYLYDAIRATAGEDISITAFIDDGTGESMTSGCSMTFSSDEEELLTVEGTFVPDTQAWSFKVPAKETKGLKGRYWYKVNTPDMSINFKEPIYLE